MKVEVHAASLIFKDIFRMTSSLVKGIKASQKPVRWCRNIILRASSFSLRKMRHFLYTVLQPGFFFGLFFFGELQFPSQTYFSSSFRIYVYNNFLRLFQSRSFPTLWRHTCTYRTTHAQEQYFLCVEEWDLVSAKQHLQYQVWFAAITLMRKKGVVLPYNRSDSWLWKGVLFVRNGLLETTSTYGTSSTISGT